MEKITNEEVLRRMNKDRKVANTVKQQNLEYFGHIMIHLEKYDILHL